MAAALAGVNKNFVSQIATLHMKIVETLLIVITILGFAGDGSQGNALAGYWLTDLGYFFWQPFIHISYSVLHVFAE